MTNKELSEETSTRDTQNEIGLKKFIMVLEEERHCLKGARDYLTGAGATLLGALNVLDDIGIFVDTAAEWLNLAEELLNPEQKKAAHHQISRLKKIAEIENQGATIRQF